MKTCITCKKVKSKLEFYKHIKAKDKLASGCKSCHKAYSVDNKEKIISYKKTYRKTNKEKIAIKAKVYFLANKEKIIIKSKHWYENNKEKVDVYTLANKEKIKNNRKIYYENNKEEAAIKAKVYKDVNKEKIAIKAKVWQQANPDNYIRAKHRRRALKLNAGGTYTVLDINTLLVNQDIKCVYCKTELILEGKGKYHVDHKMPLFLGGSNYPDNLQLLCPSCNCSKGAKHPYVFEKTFILAMKL